jgi:endo-1,4-beta-xylanase
MLLTACGSGSNGTKITPQPATLRQAASNRGLIVSSAAATPYLAESDYSNVLGTEYNGLTAEWEMKFTATHPRPNTDPNPYDFSAGDQLVAFAQTNTMQVRGHTLIWHGDNPAWLTNGGYTAPEMNAIVQDHITHVMQHFGSHVFAWDVVNEAFNDDGSLRSTIFYDQPGIGFAGQGTAYIEQSLRWASAANPSAKLFYNDYGAEVVNTKSDAILAMATDFKNRGVPLHGIGFQMHVDLGFDDVAILQSFASNLQRFATLGLELHITELDIRVTANDPNTLNLQAALYGKIVSACVQQPACKMVQTWGFTDKHSWIPDFFPGYGWALPFDDTYQKKPAYSAIYNALK